MAGNEEKNGKCSSMVSLIYIFNLIVGTGALALPKAFGEAGYVLGSITLTLLCLVSLVTTAYIMEAMSIANALKRLDIFDNVQLNSASQVDNEDITCETAPLMKYSSPSSSTSLINPKSTNAGLYDIIVKVELGEMAAMFFNRFGKVLFYFALCLYLYGDLAIYSAAIPKSIRDAACTAIIPYNATAWQTEEMLCWTTVNISRIDAYRIFLAIFALFIIPCVFLELRKTVALQLVTSVLRWLAFILMLVYAILRLTKSFPSSAELGSPPEVANFQSLPNLFGVSVYAFMCHHSLPNLIAPLQNKHIVMRLLSSTYALILVFYIALACTGAAAFVQLEDFYTLNFGPSHDAHVPLPIAYFLLLFPVFTLSASFPIIAVTLRNNLIAMVSEFVIISTRVRRFVFPLLTVIPPILIACGTNNLTQLVGITGSYGGLFVQYVIPVGLVWAARKERARKIPQYLFAENDQHDSENAEIDEKSRGLHVEWHRSIFAGSVGLSIILAWSLMSFVFVTFDKFYVSHTPPNHTAST